VSDWMFVFFATRRRACGSTISAAALLLQFALYRALLFLQNPTSSMREEASWVAAPVANWNFPARERRERRL
jgi:hypothetical protein